jgi:DNA invertase Pin-like site-specific DNA recombinase
MVSTVAGRDISPGYRVRPHTTQARGRVGGRPKGLSKKAQHTAIIAEKLYQERELTVKENCEQLSISRGTLYNYLWYRGIDVISSPVSRKHN